MAAQASMFADDPDDLNSPKRLHAELLKRSGRLYGGRLWHLLQRLPDVPRMYEQATRSWLVPLDRVDDVLTYAEHRQRRFVTVVDLVAGR